MASILISKSSIHTLINYNKMSEHECWPGCWWTTKANVAFHIQSVSTRLCCFTLLFCNQQTARMCTISHVYPSLICALYSSLFISQWYSLALSSLVYHNIHQVQVTGCILLSMMGTWHLSEHKELLCAVSCWSTAWSGYIHTLVLYGIKQLHEHYVQYTL